MRKQHTKLNLRYVDKGLDFNIEMRKLFNFLNCQDKNFLPFFGYLEGSSGHWREGAAGLDVSRSEKGEHQAPAPSSSRAH